MTQVDRITEDIDHMPVAAFIFRDKESDEVHYSKDTRYLIQNQIKDGNKLYPINRDHISPALVR